MTCEAEGDEQGGDGECPSRVEWINSMRSIRVMDYSTVTRKKALLVLEYRGCNSQYDGAWLGWVPPNPGFSAGGLSFTW